MKLKIWYC